MQPSAFIPENTQESLDQALASFHTNKDVLDLIARIDTENLLNSSEIIRVLGQMILAFLKSHPEARTKDYDIVNLLIDTPLRDILGNGRVIPAIKERLTRSLLQDILTGGPLDEGWDGVQDLEGYESIAQEVVRKVDVTLSN